MLSTNQMQSLKTWIGASNLEKEVSWREASMLLLKVEHLSCGSGVKHSVFGDSLPPTLSVKQPGSSGGQFCVVESLLESEPRAHLSTPFNDFSVIYGSLVPSFLFKLWKMVRS